MRGGNNRLLRFVVIAMTYGADEYSNYPLIPSWVTPPWEIDADEDEDADEEELSDDHVELWGLPEDE